MQNLAPWFGFIASSILVLLSMFGLYKKVTTTNSKSKSKFNSDFSKIPKFAFLLMILFGVLMGYVCYVVLFMDESSWLINQLAKFFISP